jgi:hypothetical protein
VDAVEFEDADREEAAEGVAELGAGVEDCGTEGVLLAVVEDYSGSVWPQERGLAGLLTRQEVQCSWKEDSLNEANEESCDEQTSEAMD